MFHVHPTLSPLPHPALCLTAHFVNKKENYYKKDFDERVDVVTENTKAKRQGGTRKTRN